MLRLFKHGSSLSELAGCWSARSHPVVGSAAGYGLSNGCSSLAASIAQSEGTARNEYSLLRHGAVWPGSVSW